MPHTHPAESAFFREHGYLRLAGFHSASALAPLRRSIQDQARRLIEGKGGAALRRLPVFQQIGRCSAAVRVPQLQSVLMTPALAERIAQLGEHASAAIQDAQLLLSPPAQGDWTLQGLNWHVDIAAGERLPGIQAFFLIDDVAAHGGATLALAGSHRLAGRPPLAARLRALLKDPADLQRRLDALGIELLEMCGRAGDVYLMDMRLLHTPSVNASARLRMMATARCLIGA